MKNYIIILFFLLLIFIIPFAEARWAQHEDANVEYEVSNLDIVVNKDGSYKEKVELHGKILKESARDYFAHYRLNYNSDASQINILEAKTIHNGKEYVITPDRIEDKPLASLGHGFDQIKQITISFPNIEIGSEIYLKYKQTTHKVPVKNFYGSILYSAENASITKSNIHIQSQLPLNIKVNDPRNVLKVVNNNAHEIDIILKHPLFDHVVNERGTINSKHLTWIALSSLSEWADLAKEISPKYYYVINQKLPEMFMSIAKAVNVQDTDEDKINFVTSKLNEKVQYMGDWRTVEGGYFPRDLQQIADSQVGDCKDFSTATAAILQDLGYKVQPVWVVRGVIPYFNPINSLPVTYFNHAILKVINKENKVYWIDPTNIVSMAQGIFPDISGRTALVLDNGNEAGLAKIPAVKHQNSKVIDNKTLLIKDDLVEVQGTITLKGESALNLAGGGLYYSNTNLRERVFNMISGVYLTDNEKKFLELPDLTSRIVEDLSIKYAFERKKGSIFQKTSLGDAFTLRDNDDWLDRVIGTTPDQVSDVFMGIPRTIETYRTIKGRDVSCSGLDFEISSPWLNISRSCKHHEGDTELIDVVSVLKSFITQKELQSAEYKNLKDKIEHDFAKVAVIIN